MTAQLLPGGFEAPLTAGPAIRWQGPAQPGGGGGSGYWLVQADGRRSRLPVRRWSGPPEPAVRAVVDRCAGPTVDLGCGPGRLVAALAERGLVALGVDVSEAAVRQTRSRGGAALRADLFGPMPGTGRWAHALLIDGNIGIGGDPVRLLRRCAELVRPGGTVLVEVEPPGVGLWCGWAHVVAGHTDRQPLWGPAFRWARLGVAAVAGTAARSGLEVGAVFDFRRRWFAELVRR